jgi:hypothetical protein
MSMRHDVSGRATNLFRHPLDNGLAEVEIAAF